MSEAVEVTAAERDRVPPGFRRVEGIDGYFDAGALTEVWTNGRETIFVGDPYPEEPEGNMRHDCDAMGCGWAHVLGRIVDNQAEAEK